MKTFIQRYLDGKVPDPHEEINDDIDAWHNLNFEHQVIGLPKFLGMTDEEYGQWVSDPKSLESILSKYKKLEGE